MPKGDWTWMLAIPTAVRDQIAETEAALVITSILKFEFEAASLVDVCCVTAGTTMR